MSSLKKVGDAELLRRLSRLVGQSRRVEADVVAHIGEVEARRLYAREGCPSMFEYCRRALRLRENEAYLRITVARAVRENPLLLAMLRDGRLHLSGIARLAPHLTPENSHAVLERAAGMSHRQIRELVAELEPRPDVPPTIRRLPDRRAPGRVPASPAIAGAPQLGAPRVRVASPTLDACPPNQGLTSNEATPAADGSASAQALPAPLPHSPVSPPTLEPLAPGRHKVTFTASTEFREKLERLQALMRSSVSDGDLARIIDIAVTEKLERLEARRFAKTKPSRKGLSKTNTTPSSRHIPAAVRRRVYERDGGRCAYRDRRGRRCGARHGLEYHHKEPYGHGGDHSPGNLTLLCRAHNALLAEQDYGAEVMARFRASSRLLSPGRSGVPVDVYGAPITVRPRMGSPG